MVSSTLYEWITTQTHNFFFVTTDQWEWCMMMKISKFPFAMKSILSIQVHSNLIYCFWNVRLSHSFVTTYIPLQLISQPGSATNQTIIQLVTVHLQLHYRHSHKNCHNKTKTFCSFLKHCLSMAQSERKGDSEKPSRLHPMWFEQLSVPVAMPRLERSLSISDAVHHSCGLERPQRSRRRRRRRRKKSKSGVKACLL